MSSYEDAESNDFKEGEEKEFKKRNPSINKKIADLSKDDSRVAVIGTIIDADEKNMLFTIDDSSKKISAIVYDEKLMQKAKVGKTSRVIGTIISNDSGLELKAEFIQDFTGINAEHYNKYLELAKAKA